MIRYGTAGGCLFIIDDAYPDINSTLRPYGFGLDVDEAGNCILDDADEIGEHISIVFIIVADLPLFYVHNPVVIQLTSRIKAIDHVIFMDQSFCLPNHITVRKYSYPTAKRRYPGEEERGRPLEGTRSVSACAHDNHHDCMFRIGTARTGLSDNRPWDWCSMPNSLTTIHLYMPSSTMQNMLVFGKILRNVLHATRIELSASDSMAFELQSDVEYQLTNGRALYLSLPRFKVNDRAKLSIALQRSGVTFYKHGVTSVTVVPRNLRREIGIKMQILPPYRLITNEKIEPPDSRFGNCWPLYKNKYSRIFWMWWSLLKAYIKSNGRQWASSLLPLVSYAIFPLLGGRFLRLNSNRIVSIILQTQT